MTQRSQRIGALAGGLFFVLFYVTFLTTGSTPSVNATGAKIADHYDSGATIGFEAISIMVMTTALMFFAGAIRSRFGKDSWLSPVITTGAAITGVGFALFGMTQIMIYDARKLSEPVLQTLNVIDNDNFLPVALGISVFLLAVGSRIVSTGALPTWVGWVAIVLGVLPVTGPPGFIAFLGFPLWVGVASLTMYMRREVMAADSMRVDLTSVSSTNPTRQPSPLI